MDMDAYHHFIEQQSAGSTAHSAGEAAQQQTSSFSALLPAHPTESNINKPTSIFETHLMNQRADQQLANLNAKFLNSNTHYPFLKDGHQESKTAHHAAYPVHDYKPSENAMLLHTRMGHASKKVMINALKQGINLGVPITLNELIHSNIYCKAGGGGLSII